MRWGGVNLAVVDWTPFTDRKAALGDEQVARDFKPEPFTERGEQQKLSRRERAQARAEHAAQQSQERLWRFQAAVRANRQLATVLRDQGMNEEADHFAYHAQMLQRRVFWRQRQVGRWAFWVFLEAIAGYGYRLWSILAAYGLTLAAFAVAFYLAGLVSAPHLTPYEAVIVSFTAVHGRVFLGQFGLDSTLSLIAGIEAVFGIVIEGVFVAMLIQRFFAQ